MKRERLTIERIKRLQCPEGKQQAFLWDTENPRLAVRITKAGARSYVYESKIEGKTIRRTIGAVSDWTVEDARKAATRLQTTVDTGTDPREQDRARAEAKAAAAAAKAAAAVAAALAEEQRQKYTLRALCEAYADWLVTQGKAKSAGAARSAFTCHLYRPHPDVAATPAQDVTSDQVADLVRSVVEAGKARSAGVLRAYLLAAFNVAMRARYDVRLPIAFKAYGITVNPVAPIPASKANAGNRTLSVAEVKAYMAHLTDDLYDQALMIEWLAGGQRIAQLLRAKVADYDVEAQTLLIFDGKGKRTEPRAHMLPLGPAAAALVADLAKRAARLKTPLLFSTSGTVGVAPETCGKRVTEISKAMGGDPFTLRDIRRTAETMLAGMGISRDTRAQLLSHGISGVQAVHYDRHNYFHEKRAALVAWEARLQAIASGSAADQNVVPLQRRVAPV